MVRSIFIAGGSCSGKSELARALIDALRPSAALILHEDSYFKDRPSSQETANRGADLDRPEAKDRELLCAHVQMMRAGETTPRIEFDFKQRKRRPVTSALGACDFLIVEGLHVLADEPMRACADLKVFVDAPEFLRLARRVVRDSIDRGRTTDFIVEQFLGSVRRGHDETVEPQREWADIIIDGGFDLSVRPRPGDVTFAKEASMLAARIRA
jgi:uridine kinase